MGTTCYVSFKLDGKVQGFSVSGDGYYEGIGLNAFSKYKQHTQQELIDFYRNRLTFLDPYTNDPVIEQKIEDSLDEMYMIWDYDWNTAVVEIEDGIDMVYPPDDGYSREYGYMFNLDNDTLEVRRGGESNIRFAVDRSNIDRMHPLFLHGHAIANHYDRDDDFEELFLNDLNPPDFGEERSF